jgi:hypothetical protein
MEEHISIYAILLQDLMKRVVCRCGVEMRIHKTKTRTPNSKWETTNSNPPGPIITIGQWQEPAVRSYLLRSSRASRLLFSHHPEQTLQKCRAKSILLSQTSIFWVLLVEFQFAGWHTEQSWSCSKLSLLFAKNKKGI